MAINIMKVLLICGVLSCLVNGISGYTVTGNKIYDPSGAKVTIRGIDRPSFEWVATGEQASLADYTLMKTWGANVVRISTNQDFWFASSSYAATIDQQIAWVTQLGMGVILDLHWNNGAQQNMADRNSITFWSQVATRYKNNAWVMFELYNEPHDVSWSQWLNGDATYAGMQQMYDAVRAAGSNNLVIVCGLNWAFDLSGVSSGYKLTGTNIAYATHPYDYPGKQFADWPAAFGNLAATYPIIMTEFGQYCATNTYVQDLLTYAESLGIHWTAWAWYVSGCAFPSIIADWAGTPSSGVGVIVKSFLSGKGTTGTIPTYSPTPSPTTGGATSALAIYSDGLASGWQDWSWSTSYSLSDTTYVRSGSKAIKFELVSYQGVYLHSTSPVSIGSYNQLNFYVNGGTSSKSASAASVKLYGPAGTVVGNSVSFTSAPTANQWSQISIPISSFGVASSTAISGFVFQSNVDTPSAGFIWIDDVSFVPSSSSGTAAPTTKPTSAPTTKPTTAPTTKPTTAPTPKPTNAPTPKPTTAPTAKPTNAPTSKPTTPATAAPTSKPTTAPTPKPTSAATPKPTAAPVAPTTTPTSAPTSAPGTCSASSVSIVQTAGASWQSEGRTITQYTVSIRNACSKKLVGLTLTASNWNAINYWNIVQASTGGNVFNLPSYASVTSSAPFEFGYQNVGGQASFSLSGATFQ